MFFLILGGNLVHRFRHAGRSKDGQVDFIAVPGGFVLFLVRPASGQGKSQRRRQDRCDYFFPRHHRTSPFCKSIYMHLLAATIPDFAAQ